MDTHLLEPECLGPYLRQHLLCRCPGRDEASFQVGPISIRLEKQPTVYLAVWSKRQTFQHHKGGGHHVFGQSLSDGFTELADPGRGLRGGDKIGHQARVSSRVLAGHHDSFFHPFQVQERHLNLGDLDPVAPDLRLKVLSAQVLKAAVGQHAAQVSGKVDPFVSAARVGHEGCLSKIRPPPIPWGEIATPDRDLTNRVETNLATVFIEQQHFHVLERVAHGHHSTGILGILVDEDPPHNASLRGPHTDSKHAVGREVFLV